MRRMTTASSPAVLPFITLARAGDTVDILDQTALPFATQHVRLHTVADAARAISTMQVRGAPLIGLTAAYGVALALADDAGDDTLAAALAQLGATRPTAVNLHWALDAMRNALQPLPPAERREAAWRTAAALQQDDAARCTAIGRHGAALLAMFGKAGRPLHVLTHCNAGALATCGLGTALAPFYVATAQGRALHVYVSETRPRNQGLLTAWELERAGIAHSVVADNAAGWLLAEGRVDLVITGADRIAANGDSANKVGTYLKALAARAHGVPFYIAAPRSTIDFACPNGRAIPIEERSADEVRLIHGLDEHGAAARLRIAGDTTAACNPAFDVTPAGLLAGIICEFGVFAADDLAAIEHR